MSALNRAAPETVHDQHFDIIIVGTGFGSLFFLNEALRRPDQRILVIEWGDDHSHQWQLEQGRNSAVQDETTYRTTDDKVWNYTIGFGGGTNCWFAQTPRFHPNDFRLQTLYGVGEDWPVQYSDLETYYAEAEAIMSVSGDPDMAAVMPRSTPFPQPPHRMSTPDRMMKAAQPGRHFTMPTARARIATENRAACCASLRCQLCPVEAKFTANNGLRHLFSSPNVQICLKARAHRFETQNGSVNALVFEHGDREYRVRGDLFVLGANAIQSPAIMLRSGMEHPLTGVGLHESFGAGLEVYLDGVDNFDGSTITTGLNYSLYDGPHRTDSGAALLYFENRWDYGFRPERGKMRQTLPIVIVTEDLLLSDSQVVLNPPDPGGPPRVTFAGPSAYATRGMERAIRLLPEVLAPLPVEKIVFRRYRPTESHLQGTLRMGRDPKASVVDAHQIHHRWRNLVVVGTAVFASCSSANPSLTAAALSLRAARCIMTGD